MGYIPLPASKETQTEGPKEAAPVKKEDVSEKVAEAKKGGWSLTKWWSNVMNCTCCGKTQPKDLGGPWKPLKFGDNQSAEDQISRS